MNESEKRYLKGYLDGLEEAMKIAPYGTGVVVNATILECRRIHNELCSEKSRVISFLQKLYGTNDLFGTEKEAEQ